MKIKENSIQIISLPKIEDRRGNLSVIENDTIPFEIKRVYYVYDIPSGAERGGHAHKNLQQFLVALSGSFDVILNDGKEETSITLNKPNLGLLIKPGIWRKLQNFSSGAICLVIASEVYIEEDYIRDFDEFKKYVIDKH
jgi:oxalate decarboxylase/phosphoglucose isomerase-like protein (cupin superfamily)